MSCFADSNNDSTKNGQEQDVASTGGKVDVGPNDDIVCILTNTRKHGDIELRKVWSGTKGNVTLNIGTTAGGSDVKTKSLTGADGTTDAKTVDTATYYMSETFDTPTVAADYSALLTCFNDKNHDGSFNYWDAVVGSANGVVIVGDGQDVVCTFTNTRKHGDIELKKVWSGTPGNATVKIGTSSGGYQVAKKSVTGADGGTVPTTVNTGTYYVSETIDSPTVAADYTSTIACFDDQDHNDAKNGTEPTIPVSYGALTVGDGQDVICTFTNTRKQGDVELKKVWSGTAGNIRLQIGTAKNGDDTVYKSLSGVNGTTDAKTVNTGTYYFSEQWITPTVASDYVSTLTCFDDQDHSTAKNGTEPTITPGGDNQITLTVGQDVVCTFTNTKKATNTVLYNGQQLVMQGASLVVGAQLTSTNTTVCSLGSKTVKFVFELDPTNPVAGSSLTKQAVTDSAGQATLTINTATAPAWQPGTYDIHIVFDAGGGCLGATDEGAVTVASPADAATGGGAYQTNGRVNFGFNVHRVGTTTPAVYKGQILLMNNGKWRLKGDLNAFTKLAAGANGNKCPTGFVMGSAEGVGTLQFWDTTSTWVQAAINVHFSVTFCDNTVTGKKVASDKFGIIIDYKPVTPQPSTLPNSLPVDLSNGASSATGGGNIDIKK